MKLDVIGIGTVVVDQELILPRYPDPDSKVEIMGDRLQVGGPVPTAFVFLRRLGKRCGFLGKWAADDNGRLIETDLLGEDVDISHCHPAGAGRTGFAHVWLDEAGGTRTIAFFRGSHPVAIEDVAPSFIKSARWLHLDGWSTDAAIHAAAAMKEQGGRVYLDLGSPKGRLDELLRIVDFLNCPRRLLDRLFGSPEMSTGADRLLGMGPSLVTVTDGERGALLKTRDGEFAEVAPKVDAVDSNGAGDVFAGAMSFGLMHQWPRELALRFAMTAAALKCMALGNRASLPGKQALLDGLERWFRIDAEQMGMVDTAMES